MFGYIQPEKPELKMKDYDLFRGYYCSVCKTLGKRCGQLSRFTLSYDTTFLAVLLSCVGNQIPILNRERCFVHPMQKKNIVSFNKYIDYSSDMGILLTYYNLKDNIEDEKSYLSATAVALFKNCFKKINKLYPEKCDIIGRKLGELNELEKNNCRIIDNAAEPFAELMSEVFKCPYLEEDDSITRALGWIGYNVGRWIYILDAYDDIEKDIKKKNYNPIILQYEFDSSKECIEAFKNRIVKNIEFSLTYTISEIAKAFELIEGEQNRDIINNIIYLGIRRKTDKILYPQKYKESSKEK